MKIENLRKTATFAFFMVVMLLLHEAKAEGKAAKTSEDNSRIKLLYELTFPDCIEDYSLKKSKDGSLRVGKVMTSDEVYSIDENLEKKLVMRRKITRSATPTPADEITRKDYERYRKRVQEHPEIECGISINTFSPDGKYMLETVSCGLECTRIRLTDLVTNKSITFEDGSYISAISDKTFLATGFDQKVARIIDWSGNLINTINPINIAKGFKTGFVAYCPGSKFIFMNSEGEIYNSIEHYSMGINFDVDFETGTTAIVSPKTYQNGKESEKSSLFVYNFKGKLIHRFELPFTGYRIGVGVSKRGDYVSVLSKQGWVCLFDVKNKKELWKQEYDWGGRFSDWSDPIPVSAEGKYVVVYGNVNDSGKDYGCFIIYDITGKIVDKIKSPASKKYILYCNIKFVPGTTKIAVFYGKKMSVFEIQESE